MLCEEMGKIKSRDFIGEAAFYVTYISCLKCGEGGTFQEAV
jgi:hypothetical protein